MSRAAKITHAFAGMFPPTLETFVALVRIRYRQQLLLAIQTGRCGEVDRYEHALGVADGMVAVLYDVNTDDAHGKLQRVQRVKRAILAHLERERAMIAALPHGG